MKFNYKGIEWDTDKNNRLQVTKDEGLKQATIDAYFPDGLDNVSKKELAFQQALLCARYESIISEITGGTYSMAGTYPEWVLKEAEDYSKEMNATFINDYISHSDTLPQLVSYLQNEFLK